jgi:hypothetical protein
VFVIDGKDHDQQHNDDCMARSEAKLHFGVPDTGSWSVEKLHHRNVEMSKCEKHLLV